VRAQDFRNRRPHFKTAFRTLPSSAILPKSSHPFVRHRCDWPGSMPTGRLERLSSGLRHGLRLIASTMRDCGRRPFCRHAIVYQGASFAERHKTAVALTSNAIASTFGAVFTTVCAVGDTVLKSQTVDRCRPPRHHRRAASVIPGSCASWPVYKDQNHKLVGDGDSAAPEDAIETATGGER
jgi:hypothetical protein